MNKLSDDQKMALIVISAITILVVIAVLIYNLPSNKTKRILKANAGDHGTNNHEMPISDGWGTSLRYTYIETKTLKTFLVTSAGADRQFDTSDDMTIEERDYNKSRIIGKYVTDKLKEVTKGVKDSLLEEGNPEHDKDHEGLGKKIGKKVGGTIKNLKEGFKDGITGDSD